MGNIIMDNFHIDVTARGEEALELCLSLALMKENYATHWCNHPDKGLVLFWHNPNEGGPLTRVIKAKHEFVELPTRGSHPGQEIYVKREGYTYGTNYIWSFVQDEGGDPGDWVWVPQKEHRESVGVHPFPYKMKSARELTMFVNGWLKEGAVYGSQPDHDGSNAKGFRVYNDRWGQVEGCGHYSFVAIQPEWAELGK